MQDPLPVPHLLDQLAQFAHQVGAALSTPAVNWHWRPDSAEWSLTEVVCHLRDVEREVHQKRYRDLITSKNVFLSGVTADDWAETRNYRQQDGRQALKEFLAARQETITLLKAVTDDAIWERRGQHAFFGPTSLHELLSLAVQHDQLHWQQIQNLLHQVT